MMLNQIKKLGRNTGARNWKRWFPEISPRCQVLISRADEVLRSPSRLSASLLNLEMEVRSHLQQEPDLQIALDTVLGDLERERGFPTHVRMSDELSADQFMQVIRSGTPFKDVGVSILHGSQTHRIQFRILADHMGTKDTQELLQHIAAPANTPGSTESIEYIRRPDPTGPAASDQFHFTPIECKEDQTQKTLTLYDDLFDVQSPVYYPNEEQNSMCQIFSGKATRKDVIVSEDYFPVLDARSPEWLQHLVLSSSDMIPLISGATRAEVNERLDEVHQGVFATGFETCKNGLLADNYKNVGFSCASAGLETCENNYLLSDSYKPAGFACASGTGIRNRPGVNSHQKRSFHSSTARRMPDAAIAQLKGAYGSGVDNQHNQHKIQNKDIPMVVGAAFPRTGTNSLKLALERLGFGPAYHIQEMCLRNHLPLWDVPGADYTRKEGEPYSYGDFPTLPDFDKILREPGFRSGVDVPFCLFWKDIYNHFDGAKVVLTLRDPESWYKSCFDTIYKSNLEKPGSDGKHLDSVPLERRVAYKAIPELKALWEWETKSHWDPWVFHSKTEAIDSYLGYQDHVRSTVPKEDLLEFRVQDGWAPLCEFLGVDEKVVEGEGFPRVNDTASQLAEAEKVDAIGRAIRVASSQS